MEGRVVSSQASAIPGTGAEVYNEPYMMHDHTTCYYPEDSSLIMHENNFAFTDPSWDIEVEDPTYGYQDTDSTAENLFAYMDDHLDPVAEGYSENDTR